MQVLGRRLELERIDCHLAVAQTEFEIAPAQQCGELSVAVSQIQNDRQRRILLCMRDAEVHKEGLAAARRAEYQRVSHVLDMQVEEVRRAVRRLEDCQRLLLQVWADTFTLIESEDKAQIRGVGLQKRQPSQVVNTIARDDAHPGVQKVVGLFEQRPVVYRKRFPGLSRLLLKSPSVVSLQNQRQGTLPEEVPVHLGFR